MRLAIQCLACFDRKVWEINPKAPDDLLWLADRLVRACEGDHVLLVASEEMAEKIEAVDA